MWYVSTICEGQQVDPFPFLTWEKKDQTPKETVKHMGNEWITAKRDKISEEIEWALGQNYNLVKGANMLV